MNSCFDVQNSTNNIPSGQNWADIAFLAPTLSANNLLEIGVDSKENCFLTLPDIYAYDKFARMLKLITI